MIRCRECNSELTDQARFCNVCGLPQNPQEPEQENSTHIGQKALDTNTTIPCENCATELQKMHASVRYAAPLKHLKNPLCKKRPLNDPVTPASTSTNKEGTSTHLKPSASVKPEEATKNVNDRFQKRLKMCQFSLKLLHDHHFSHRGQQAMV